MKIQIVTDTWTPQVNGVVTILKNCLPLIQKEHDVNLIEPSQFLQIRTRNYRNLCKTINFWKIFSKIKNYNPDVVLILTSGTLGFAAALYCKMKGIKHLTSFETQHPKYLKIKYFIPESIGHLPYKLLHYKSDKVLAFSRSLMTYLHRSKYKNLYLIQCGVDPIFKDLKYMRNCLLYVGRLSKEKRVEDFLNYETDFTKIIVGNGPQFKRLKRKYESNKCFFVGGRPPEELVKFYNRALVTVFPSKSDTFGLTVLEALACGSPVAAYSDAIGAIDFITNGINGFKASELRDAIDICLDTQMTLGKLNMPWELTAEDYINACIEVCK